MDTERKIMKKIAVIGSASLGKSVFAQALREEEKVVLVDDSLPQELRMVQPIEKLPTIDLYGGKKFKCKGRHEYRLVATEKDGNLYKQIWQCECGRKIND